jgi:catechol 2,3-dioxygenase-like lactoylglutathione lyase family enzyme
MAKAIHMMVRVLDAEKSIDFYERAFGLTIADRFDFDDFTLVYLRNPEADFEVELTVNKGRTEPYDHGDEPAARHGHPQYHHVDRRQCGGGRPSVRASA